MSGLTLEKHSLPLTAGGITEWRDYYLAADVEAEVKRLTEVEKFLRDTPWLTKNADLTAQLAAMTQERDEWIQREAAGHTAKKLYLEKCEQLAASEQAHDVIRQLCEREGVHHPEVAITKLKQQLAVSEARVKALESEAVKG